MERFEGRRMHTKEVDRRDVRAHFCEKNLNFPGARAICFSFRMYSLLSGGT